MLKSIFLSVAVVGVFGLTASLSARAAEPAVLRVILVLPADIPAYVHEIEGLRALYKKQDVAVTIDAYKVTYGGPVVDLVLVEVGVANLTALATMDAITRTQPDLVTEMKKIGGMQKLIFDGVFDKLTPDVPGLTAPLSVRGAEPAVLRGTVVQTADLPAYVHEIEALRALYKKQGLAVTIDLYQGNYAGPNVGELVTEVRVANLAALAKMDEMTRTQPDLVNEMKKIGEMRKVAFNAIYEKLTP